MWHRKIWAGPAIRLGGMIFLIVAGLSGHRLFGHAQSPAETSAPALYLLASILFVGASLGSAMLAWGAHLFDDVEVSARWRTRDHPSEG